MRIVPLRATVWNILLPAYWTALLFPPSANCEVILDEFHENCSSYCMSASPGQNEEGTVNNKPLCWMKCYADIISADLLQIELLGRQLGQCSGEHACGYAAIF
jgi:hypothetical protein